MKILVIQTARFGDIFLTWPILSALQRQYPEADIHFLVRARFSSAAKALQPAVTVHTLDSAHCLEPVLMHDDHEKSLARLERLSATLAHEKFDRVINLGFSELSATLCEMAAASAHTVQGYRLFRDGTLNLNGPAGRYFFAYTGPQHLNRRHITELFSWVAETELLPCDFAMPQTFGEKLWDIVFHCGASQVEKSLSLTQQTELLLRLEALGFSIRVVGALSERTELAKSVGRHDRALSRRWGLEGETSWGDVAETIARSKIVIGADSVAIHLASLLKVRCLQLSCAHVSLYETGPLAHDSRILFAPKMTDYQMNDVASEAVLLLENAASDRAFARVNNYKIVTRGGPGLLERFIQNDEVSFGRSEQKEALALFASNRAFLQALKRQDQKSMATQMKSFSDTFERFAATGPMAYIVAQWFRVESGSIEPQAAVGIVRESIRIHQQLSQYLNLGIKREEKEIYA